MEAFYAKLADILEVDEIKPDGALRDFEAWDSLSVLSILAMTDKEYGVNLVATDLAPIKTAAELAALIQSRKRA